MATAQKEKNGTYTGRARVAGLLNVSKGGFRTKADAKDWARDREREATSSLRPQGKGPARTTVADALLQDGMETLPFKKGAPQEVARLNVWLRAAGRPTLEVVKCNRDDSTDGESKGFKYFDVLEVPAGQERRVVPSLKAHRERQARGATTRRR